MIGNIIVVIAVLVFVAVICSCIIAACKANKVIEKCWHNCHYKKHYDHKKKCYVYRCPKCGKEIEQTEKTGVL